MPEGHSEESLQTPIAVDTAVSDDTFLKEIKQVQVDEILGVGEGDESEEEAIDSILAEDTLSRVVDKFKSDPRLGAIACKIVNAVTKELDPNSGWIFSELDKADQDLEFLSYSFCSAGT